MATFFSTAAQERKQQLIKIAKESPEYALFMRVREATDRDERYLVYLA